MVYVKFATRVARQNVPVPVNVMVSPVDASESVPWVVAELQKSAAGAA
jgi:hypothetical protein